MLRPRLRPTISRRNKYLGIAPQAETKLRREARRGSHDLRKLVGHANFLDNLVESLDPQSDDDNRDESSAHPNVTLGDESIALEDDESESDDEEWSDSSDDEDHALLRTASGTSIVDIARSLGQDTRNAIAQGEADYFSAHQARATEPAVEEAALEFKQDFDVTVCEVISPLSDTIDEPAGDDASDVVAKPNSDAVDSVSARSLTASA